MTENNKRVFNTGTCVHNVGAGNHCGLCQQQCGTCGGSGAMPDPRSNGTTDCVTCDGSGVQGTDIPAYTSPSRVAEGLDAIDGPDCAPRDLAEYRYKPKMAPRADDKQKCDALTLWHQYAKPGVQGYAVGYDEFCSLVADLRAPRADGSAAEVKRYVMDMADNGDVYMAEARPARDKHVLKYVEASAYDAVVAENARLKERLRDFAGKGTEYASRVAELERDAARYRWLRNRWWLGGETFSDFLPEAERHGTAKLTGDGLDSAIDAALSKGAQT